MRKPPELQPAPCGKAEFTEIRTYRFLTPVFGGGVEINGCQKPFDPVTPIRVASIRGQLRFWWRACNPRGCKTVKELRKAEEMVFGSTEKASPLAITVLQQPGIPSQFEVMQGNLGTIKGLEALGYGAFPLRKDKNDKQHGVLWRYKGSWKLGFTYQDAIEDDVHAALWAWAHFGGLGGRTRRGFGAIAEADDASLPSIDKGYAKYVHGNSVPWPFIQKDRDAWLRVCPREHNDGVQALKYLLGKLQSLRQVPLGRKAGKVPGPSKWPEPEAIRRITGRRYKPADSKRQRIDKFPRAAFGLPIIFHFKDERNGDPHDTTLLPQGKARMASPLILRPHATSGGKKIEAMALVLGHPEPEGGYVIEFKRHSDAQKTTRSVETRLAQNEDCQPMESHTDPLKRFLEEIK